MTFRSYLFEAEIRDDVPSRKTFPVYDDLGKCIGGFHVKKGDIVEGLISGTYYDAGLLVSSGQSFYFTLSRDVTNTVCGIISSCVFDATSVKILKSEEILHDQITETE